jgi:hypothetical protein
VDEPADEPAVPADLPLFDEAPALPSRPPRLKPQHYRRRDLILDAALSCPEKAVLQAILRHMGFNRDEVRAAHAGEARLALEASVGVSTLRRCLRRLEAIGALRCEHRPLQPVRCTINFAALERLRDPRIIALDRRNAEARRGCAQEVAG